MKTTSIILIFSLIFLTRVTNARDLESVSLTKKGFFSLGVSYGLGRYRFLNTDGSQAGYRVNLYSIDSDVRLWNFGAGDFRLFANYQDGRGKSTSRSTDTIQTSEATIGIKFFAGSNLFLSASFGRGQAKIRSGEYDQNVGLGYSLYRAGVGLEFSLSSSTSCGIEFSYRNGPIKRNENLQLVENTFVEGMSAAVRFVWSPPILDSGLSSR